MSEVFNVHQQWFDPVIGGAMIAGKVYYGLPNTDPTILSNQIDVFADRALTVALPNPQTIGMGGRVENKPWVGRRYSIQVDDRDGVTRYSYPDQGENPSSGETLVLSNVQGINNITCETPAGITQYVAQQLFTLRTVATNTGDMTINIDGVGAKPIKFNFNEQIAPGFFQAQQVILLIYNSVGDNFSWANAGRGISLLTGVAGDGDTITANGGPSTIAYIDGQLYQFKPNADNTGAVTLEINGLGAIDVESNGSALSSGRFATNITYIVSYNSTTNTFELVNGVELPDATETIKGKAELATQAEVDTGTDDTRIVTPLKLSAFTEARGFLGIQTFVANGTWNKPANVTKILVICTGGGGGATNGSGGAAATSIKFIDPAASSYAIVIGTGGAASAGGNPSSVGTTVVTALGGSPSAGSNAGAGGTTGVGDLIIAGGDGFTSQTGVQGQGGASFWGGGGGGNQIVNAECFGAGGGGPNGTGKSGVVLILQFS